MQANQYSDPGMAEPTYRGAANAARETDLIAKIADGDRKAFEELYYLYHRRLARFLTRLTRRYDIAEEVINDTFWVVWTKAHTFRGESQPSTWILGIAYRKARNAFRATARLAEQNLQPELMPLTNEEPTGTEELRDWLARALAELPVEQRLAVELCYELGHSCEEIATIMPPWAATAPLPACRRVWPPRVWPAAAAAAAASRARETTASSPC